MHTLRDINASYEYDNRARSFVKSIICHGLAAGMNSASAGELMRMRGVPADHVQTLMKTAVTAVTTDDVPVDRRPFGRAFLALVATRYAFDGITWLPAPVGAPVNLEVPGAGVMAVVEEAKPIPVFGFTSNPFRLSANKIALIVAMSTELLRSDDPSATSTVERILTRTAGEGTDATAFDPTLGGSLTNGATEITGTGDQRVDIWSLLAALSGGTPSRPYIVLGAAAARSLVFSGDQIFRDVALIGRGELGGIPTITSGSSRISEYAIAVDADNVLVSDRGIDIERARGATLQMLDNPSDGAQNTVSLWQTNTVAFRVLRYVSWEKRSDAVAFLNLGGSPA